MKKMVLKVVIEDERSKRKDLQTVAGVEGVESVMKERKITVIGEVDLVFVTVKLRKFGFTELMSVGPATEEKKPEREKKEEPPRVAYVHEPYLGDEYNPNTYNIY